MTSVAWIGLALTAAFWIVVLVVSFRLSMRLRMRLRHAEKAESEKSIIIREVRIGVGLRDATEVLTKPPKLWLAVEEDIAAGRTVEVTPDEMAEWVATGKLPDSVEARFEALRVFDELERSET